MSIENTRAAGGWESLLAHRAWLGRIARRLARDEHDADDLAQEAWLRAARAPPRSHHAPRGWLATVLRRLAIDRHRADMRRARHEAAAAAPRSSASPAELAERAELHRQVTDAVLALPEPYRTTVLLRYVGDVPIAEVARRQGVPIETTRTRLRRALPLMRARLDAANGGSRRRWLAAIAPLAGGAASPLASGAATTAAGGVLAVGSKLILIVGVLAAALLAYVLAAPGSDDTASREAATEGAPDAGPADALRAGPHASAPELRGVEGAAPEPAGPGAAAPRKAPAPVAEPPASHARRPGRVAGRVVDETGRRIAAHVSIVELKEGGKRVPVPAHAAGASTDADGWYRFDGLAKGHYLLTVRAAGYIGQRPLVQAGDRPLVIELARSFPLEGIVVDRDAGVPVPGLQVLARTASSPAAGTAFVATSDAEGKFRVDPLPEGRYVVTVGPAYANTGRSPWTTREVGTFEAGTSDLRFEAVRGLAIAGEIRDAAGALVTEPMNVEAIGVTDRGDPDYGRRRNVRSTAEGRFRISGLPEGRYDLSFEPVPDGKAGPAGEALASATVRKGIAAGTEDLIVDLGEGATISGRVVDPDGEPVGVTGLLFVHPVGTVAGSQESVIVSVGTDGVFRSPSLDAATSYRILATSFKGFLQATNEGVHPGPAEVVVTLQPGGAISGRVLGEDGKPVPPGVPVMAYATDAREAGVGTSWVAYTTSGGLFTMDSLGPHTFRLLGGGGESGYTSAGAVAGVGLGAKDVTVRVQLGVEISGRFLDAAGNPVRTSYLAATERGGKVHLPSSTRVTAEDGRFTLRGLKPGKVRLRARVGGTYVELGEFEAPAKDVVVRLPE